MADRSTLTADDVAAATTSDYFFDEVPPEKDVSFIELENTDYLRRCKDGKYMLYLAREELFSPPFEFRSYRKGEDNDYTEFML